MKLKSYGDIANAINKTGLSMNEVRFAIAMEELQNQATDFMLGLPADKAMEFSKILDKLAEISEIGQEANK